jgi:phosphopentomutase
VHTVGKAGPLFDGIGVDHQHPGATNKIALEQIDGLVGSLEHGLVFANLIETDQVYGHRHDVPGFAGALAVIDAYVARWLGRIGDEDLLVLTADHGCDPTASHTDHTREYVPLLAAFGGHASRRHDGPMSDVGASALKWLTGREDSPLPGSAFL